MSELTAASTIFLACSAILVTIGAVLRRRLRADRHSDVSRARAHAKQILIVLLSFAAIAHPSIIQPSQALVPIQPESVTIGDATWYLWNQSASDTLLIWLGGGIVESTGYLVNPYEFESYNTIRFIQDLAQYYDVLALEKGSIRSVDSTLNRTIFREPYPGSYNFMQKIRSWASEQEYAYLYVVGYSVGAMVAAQELILANPESWISPDGLIIITTKIAEGVSSKANSLRASLLLLYGDKVAPEFIASGQAFFGNAPEEGWRDGSWCHREYHLIPEVEHEVWTILASGEYDGRATLLTVNFIETCKSLQFERAKETISRGVLNHTDTAGSPSASNISIVSVHSPGKVGTREAFRIGAEARYDLLSNSTIAVVAFDTDAASIISAAKKQLIGHGETWLLMTALSGENARRMHLSLIPLIRVGGNWSVITDGTRDISVDITDSYSVHVIVGYPNAIVEFDDLIFRTGTNGEITLNATRGEHVITAQPNIVIGNTARAVFQQWNVTSASSTLGLSASRDICLLAIYHRQYYMNVTSPLGRVSGAGWYDENSTAMFRVTPPIVTSNGTRAFVGWLGDSNDSSPSSSVPVNSSKKIEASWKDVKSGGEGMIILQPEIIFVASFAILLASIMYAVLLFRQRNRAPIGGTPPGGVRSPLDADESCAASHRTPNHRD
jgi:hypothetical protein